MIVSIFLMENYINAQFVSSFFHSQCKNALLELAFIPRMEETCKDMKLKRKVITFYLITHITYF